MVKNKKKKPAKRKPVKKKPITKKSVKRKPVKKKLVIKKPVKKKHRGGRTDKRWNHPKFTAQEITDDNIELFLKVIPEHKRLFALEYTRTWNAQRSYQKIFPHAKESTAKSNGYKYLQDRKIQLYLDYLAYQKNERYEVSKDELMRKLAVVTDQSLAAVPVRDSKGYPTGDYVFNAAGANKSIELQGREIGMFANRHQIEDSRMQQFIVNHYVVPEIRPIDMADPKFKIEISKAVEKHIVDRKKIK